MERNHKGEWCWIKKGLLCQEGYCVNCEIYRARNRVKFSKVHDVDAESLAKNKN